MVAKFKKDSSIGARIRKAREYLNLTRPELAKMADVSLSALQNWETDARDPQALTLIKLASILQVNPLYLLTGECELSDSQDLKELNTDNTYVMIEDFRELKISAGFGADNGDYHKPNFAKVEKAWLQSRRLKAADCAMFRVKGESMEPTLKNEEDIVVDMSKNQLEEGKIFIINHGGTIWVKKVQITFDSVELISDNPDYKLISLNQDEANNLIVIGQVVRGYRNF